VEGVEVYSRRKRAVANGTNVGLAMTDAKTKTGGHANERDASEAFPIRCLNAQWCAAIVHTRGMAEVPPPAIKVSGTVAGAEITFRGEGWAIKGYLSELATLCERVWWRSGWSSLRTYNAADAQFELFVWRTYEALAPELMPIAEGLRGRDRVLLLAILANYQVRDAAARLKASPAEAAAVEADESEELVARLFAGKKSASRLLLLKRVGAVLHDDARPMQRRALVTEAGTFVAGEAYGNPADFEDACRPFLTRLEDPEPCVREMAALLLEQVCVFLVERDAFAAALPYLDRAVTQGTNFALVHMNRFRARLALARADEAEEDWRVFAAAVEKLAAIAPAEAELPKALELQRADALVDAALACEWLRKGLSTSAEVRKRRKKPVLPDAPERERLARAQKDFGAEALERLARLIPESQRENAKYPAIIMPLKHIRHYDLRPLFEEVERLASDK
jgi:hypothetical protein